MMGDRRRRLGRFGVGNHVVLGTAIGILAMSPAIVSMVGSHVDGAGLAFVEAVFGDPVTAQEPPPTPYQQCVAEANNKYLNCLDSTPWYLEFRCWLALQFRLSACLLDP